MYDTKTHTLRKVYTEAKGWRYFHNFGDGCLISNSAASAPGILWYDSTTDSVTKLYDEGYYWSYSQQVANGLLLGSYNQGRIVLYDSTNNTIIPLYQKGTR